jgi:hypothetical protein
MKNCTGCMAVQREGRRGEKKQWVPDALSFSRHVESYISHQITDFPDPHERWRHESAADRKNYSGPKLDRQPRGSVAERNSSGPKLDGQPRRNVAERSSSGPKLDGQPRRNVAERNSSRPKLDGQPRRSAAERKPKTSLFGTDSLQCSEPAIHDHYQLAQHPCGEKAKSSWTHLDDSASEWRSPRDGVSSHLVAPLRRGSLFPPTERTR